MAETEEQGVGRSRKNLIYRFSGTTQKSRHSHVLFWLPESKKQLTVWACLGLTLLGGPDVPVGKNCSRWSHFTYTRNNIQVCSQTEPVASSSSFYMCVEYLFQLFTAAGLLFWLALSFFYFVSIYFIGIYLYFLSHGEIFRCRVGWWLVVFARCNLQNTL